MASTIELGMQTTLAKGRDWGITQDRIDEVVRRIIQVARPFKIIAFGSWARGEQHAESDLDLAIILSNQPQGTALKRPRYSDLQGVRMSVDMVISTLERYERFAQSQNSIHHQIATEGVVLYESSR